jgi:hypothetical protein
MKTTKLDIGIVNKELCFLKKKWFLVKSMMGFDMI